MKKGIHSKKISLTFASAIVIASILSFGSAGQKKSNQVQTSDFEAYMIDGVAFVTWTTSSEAENGEASLEKSINGKDFKLVQTFDLNGIESKYTFVDKDPNYGVSYYRIRHSNNAGGEDIAPLINHDGPVNFEVTSESKQIKILANQNNEKTYLVSLTDKEGKCYLLQSATFSRNQPVIIDTKDMNLKPQEYIVKLRSSEWSSSDKRILL